MNDLTRPAPWEDMYPAPGPFPVDPADVPPEAVRVVQRTLLRHDLPEDPADEDLARLLVAMVIAVLSEPAADPGAAAGLVSRYAAETGATVVITAG